MLVIVGRYLYSFFIRVFDFINQIIELTALSCTNKENKMKIFIDSSLELHFFFRWSPICILAPSICSLDEGQQKTVEIPTEK